MHQFYHAVRISEDEECADIGKPLLSTYQRLPAYLLAVFPPRVKRRVIQ